MALMKNFCDHRSSVYLTASMNLVTRRKIMPRRLMQMEIWLRDLLPKKPGSGSQGDILFL